MKLTDLNRDGGIGANCLYLEIGGLRIVIDSGFHPKKAGHESVPAHDRIPDGSLDYVILTHCHLDHLGSLPILLRRQPQAQVICSIPTQTLAPRMLFNSCNVMKRQRQELNLPELPLYVPSEVERLEHQLMPMHYERPRKFGNDDSEIEVTLYPSGHVAGAAGVKIVYKHRKIFFTGDVLFTEQKTLTGARFPKEDFDTIVTETTRGLTERGRERQSEMARLLDTLEHTFTHGGSCLLPVFALGRMQEMLAVLHEQRKQGRFADIPIYCAGLGVDIARVFDRIAKKTNLINFRKKILKELGIRNLPRDLKPGNSPGTPSLYLVSSGMLVENTPSYRVAATLLHDHQNTLCFIGYCDPDTPGGKLLATTPGEPFLFDALDYTCDLKAHIERFDLSGHADRNELLEYALGANPRAIVLTHGDQGARDWFHDELAVQAGKAKILDPQPLQTYTV